MLSTCYITCLNVFSMFVYIIYKQHKYYTGAGINNTLPHEFTPFLPILRALLLLQGMSTRVTQTTVRRKRKQRCKVGWGALSALNKLPATVVSKPFPLSLSLSKEQRVHITNFTVCTFPGTGYALSWKGASFWFGVIQCNNPDACLTLRAVNLFPPPSC